MLRSKQRRDLVRLEGIVQKMSNGMTRLRWAVNLWGATIMMLLGITIFSATTIRGHGP